jgi:hypothetical protein
MFILSRDPSISYISFFIILFHIHLIYLSYLGLVPYVYYNRPIMLPMLSIDILQLFVIIGWLNVLYAIKRNCDIIYFSWLWTAWYSWSRDWVGGDGTFSRISCPIFNILHRITDGSNFISCRRWSMTCGAASNSMVHWLYIFNCTCFGIQTYIRERHKREKRNW